jgi:cellulase
MAPTLLFLGFFLLGLVSAQTPGTSPEVHPKVKTYRCTNTGGCVRRTSAVVLDSGTHWIHQRDDPSLGCTAGGGLNQTVCPDEATCAQNCIIEGISDYASHGVTTDDDALHLEMIVGGNTQSPRIYLLSETQNRYEILKLTGNEISYDVDVSKLPCGMNGALYLSEMEERGGQGALNPAGAPYGTGYCDAQCGTQTFINGIVSKVFLHHILRSCCIL